MTRLSASVFLLVAILSQGEDQENIKTAVFKNQSVVVATETKLVAK